LRGCGVMVARLLGCSVAEVRHVQAPRHLSNLGTQQPASEASRNQANDSEPFIETLRPSRCRERGSFSNWSTEARPFARSTVGGSEVGAKLKGLDELLKDRCFGN